MTKKEMISTQIGEIRVRNGEFSIEIDSKYKEGILGLDGFSFIQVFWWGHLLDTPEYRAITVAEKAYKNAPEKLGIFATRSPVRPTPILVTFAQVLSIDHENGIIHIPYTDAEDGSPVVDIKPYYGFDRIKEVKVPDWCASWPEWYEDAANFDWSAVFLNAR